MGREGSASNRFLWGNFDRPGGWGTYFSQTGNIILADINRIASDLAGKDLSPFFDVYVEGVELISLSASLRRMGLDLTWTGGGGRASIRRIREAGPEARRLRRFILGELQ